MEEIVKEYRKKVAMILIGVIMLSATAAAVAFPAMKLLGMYVSRGELGAYWDFCSLHPGRGYHKCSSYANG